MVSCVNGTVWMLPNGLGRNGRLDISVLALGFGHKVTLFGGYPRPSDERCSIRAPRRAQHSTASHWPRKGFGCWDPEPE